MSAPDFGVDVLQNEYLPVGTHAFHAIVTVTPGDRVAADRPVPGAAEMRLDTRSTKTVRLRK